MVATAPEPTTRADWLDPFLARLATRAPATPRDDREPATGRSC